MMSISLSSIASARLSVTSDEEDEVFNRSRSLEYGRPPVVNTALAFIVAKMQEGTERQEIISATVRHFKVKVVKEAKAALWVWSGSMFGHQLHIGKLHKRRDCCSYCSCGRL